MVEMKNNNFQVFAFGSETEKEIPKKIKEQGVEFINIPLRRGLDFFGRDKIYFLRVFFLCRKYKFDICHNFTIKPCTFATLAQHFAGVKNVYCTITGLGYSFEKKGFLNKIVVFLYKKSLKYAEKVFFQNPDDRNLFVELKIVKPEKAVLIKSSGVDLKEFSSDGILRQGPRLSSSTSSSLPRGSAERPQDDKEMVGDDKGKEDKRIVVTLVARMLWSKGIKEFVEAAEGLKQKYDNVKFLLVGPIDKENPSGIPKKKIEEWQEQKTIKYLGEQKDIKGILFATDIFVLPSYGEGVPKVLLEAGAMGKPLITTDVAGCREVVENNVNGFLVKEKDSQDLAEKLEILIKDKDLREKMGRASREKMEREFDVREVVRSYIREYEIG